MNAVERARRWRENNRERHRAYSRKYYYDHREDRLLKSIEYQRNHMEEHNEVNRNWHKRNPNYRRFKHHLTRYGITPEIYEEMFRAQEGKCAICGAEEVAFSRSGKLHVDHCHVTDEIRGLLCGLCNLMLGGSRDNPEVLRRAADYLERSKKCQSEVA